jgi:hypothetical protein
MIISNQILNNKPEKHSSLKGNPDEKNVKSSLYIISHIYQF